MSKPVREPLLTKFLIFQQSVGTATGENWRLIGDVLATNRETALRKFFTDDGAVSVPDGQGVYWACSENAYKPVEVGTKTTTRVVMEELSVHTEPEPARNDPAPPPPENEPAPEPDPVMSFPAA